MNNKLVKQKANRMIKKRQAPRRRTRIFAGKSTAFGRRVITARRSSNPRMAVVVNKNITIATNKKWANAVEIPRNSGWAAAQKGESYVWGKNNGYRSVIARRFIIQSSMNKIQSATLFLAVDNYAIVFINGRPVVVDNPQTRSSSYNPGRRFSIARFLRKGRNNIVISAFNCPSKPRSSSNPAGVLARIEILFKHK